MKSNILQEGIIIIIFTAILLVLVVVALSLFIKPSSTYAYFSQLVGAVQSACSSTQYFNSLNFQNQSALVFQAYYGTSTPESCLSNVNGISVDDIDKYMLCYASISPSFSSAFKSGVSFNDTTSPSNSLTDLCNSVSGFINSITCFPITCNGLNSFISNGNGQVFFYIYNTKVYFIEIAQNRSTNYLFIVPP
ncbi:MAG: hypothetical protein QXP36_08820 [Conexivisphaerales archaeon]